MKIVLAAFAALALAACAAKEPVWLEDGNRTMPPDGYVQWCYDNPWDSGCPEHLKGPI